MSVSSRPSSTVLWIETLSASRPDAAANNVTLTLDKFLRLRNACLQDKAIYAGESTILLGGVAENASGFQSEVAGAPVCILSAKNPNASLDIVLPPGRYSLKVEGRNGVCLIGSVYPEHEKRASTTDNSPNSGSREHRRREHRSDKEYSQDDRDRPAREKRHPPRPDPVPDPAQKSNRKRKRPEGDDTATSNKKAKGKEVDHGQEQEQTPGASGSRRSSTRRAD
ncbi:hypothetical protein VKT23_015894 [Stygiomarasmius scandens]|uniref:Nucleoplasmin-like domain-containing protein n=1 Tax=Marasmiellus scandens TaxID=2682957 RepID=A0ABR1IWG8_9AGAR